MAATRRAAPKAKAEPKAAPKATACEHCGLDLIRLEDGSWHHPRTEHFVTHRPVVTE